MSLPIIRLRTVNLNHATAAEDPVTASCTLYSFLRSVPTRFECEMAMSDFRHGVQAAQGHVYLTKNNAKMLTLVSAVVQDHMFRHPPKVSPQLARTAPTWRRLLNKEELTGPAPDSTAAVQLQGNASVLRDDESTQPPQRPSPLSSVDASGQRGHNAYTGDEPCDSSEEVVVMETVSTTSTRFKSPYEQIIPPTCLPAPEHTSSTAAIEIDAGTEENQEADTDDGHREGSIHLPGKRYRPHPLLLAILERVRVSCTAEEHESDQEEREFNTMMESREKALRTKLASAFSMISPNNKGCIAFLQKIEARIAAAKKLFEVQKYEEETIRMTECALKLEVAAMRAMLRQIVDAVADAEERHEREGPRSLHYAEECQVMAAIQQALEELP
ncbi:hypothetical protein TraAM80_00528 [Trypanosoma rangeli]|uniref:Uncharacterized protein n=1 Tax=Trypanosoma rangeli TaxID=5698 RepID=A0A3R7MVU7_TRYRA|nr:uncharacterized protein TraAM80_00528 [Trypanosoma rangeli]RNF12107.1 hypothetical protein TraAM80_00528 [Trypanosoma rangeli]|eukprot:RNF12107.1 hypothetical protein TraAM80_00528 [Trypanosoma rangeli]